MQWIPNTNINPNPKADSTPSTNYYYYTPSTYPNPNSAQCNQPIAVDVVVLSSD